MRILKIAFWKENIISFIGILSAVATLLGWFGVTPEMVGERLYSFIRTFTPLIEFFIGAWCSYALLSKRHAAKEKAMQSAIDKAEGKLEANRDVGDALRAENVELKRRIEKLNVKEAKPNFTNLSYQEKAMAAFAFGEQEPFETPNDGVFSQPDCTILELLARKIVRKVTTREHLLGEVDVWRLTQSAASELRANDDLLLECQAAFDGVCDVAAKREKERERKKREEQLVDFACQLRELDYQSRALLLALVKNYDVFCSQESWDRDYDNSDVLFYSLVDWDFYSEDLIRLTAEPDLFDLYKRDPDVFGEKTLESLANREWEESAGHWVGNSTFAGDRRFGFAWWWEPKDEDEKEEHDKRVERQNQEMAELLGSSLLD